MMDWVGPNMDIVVILAVVLIISSYRWYKTRQALYRMTDAIHEILRAEGAGEIDIIRTPKIRRLLSLTQISKRLEEKICRLKTHLAKRRRGH
ncbi:MAG: hypothetical protein AB7V14_10555 [Kiritimatiellia bacterium]